MSKRRNLFKDVRNDSIEIRSSIFREAYKINNFNSCPAKEHRNNEHNPWCLHGLGQDAWFDNSKTADDDEEHFTVRPKYLNRYSGLRNLGATCYVNSLTQILFHNRKFRSALYRYTPPEDERGSIIRTLQKLLVDLEYSARGVIDTTGLVSSLQLPTTEQQDVLEFGELLFGLLNNSIPSLQDSSRGRGSYVTRCLTCGNITTRSSEFTDLKLQVQPRNRSLAERIQQLSTVEILEGDNSYHCSQCDMLRRVERCFMVNSLPKTLQLQLLRFNYNVTTMQRTKDTSFVKFNDLLTLLNLAGDSGHTSKTYKLSGIIIHVGETTQSGHYIAIVRQDNKWLTFNDETVWELDKLDLKQYDLSTARRPGCEPGEYCSQAVYMLLYEDVSEQHVLLPVVTPLLSTSHLSAESTPLLSTSHLSAESPEGSRITDYFNRTWGATNQTPNGDLLTNSVPLTSTNAMTSSDSVMTSSDSAEEGMASPPADLLSATLADNAEFHQLRELLLEQKQDMRTSKQTKAILMRDVCCRVNPENETSLIPVPTELLKNWIKTGEPQRLERVNTTQNNTAGPPPELPGPSSSDLPSLQSLVNGTDSDEVQCTGEKKEGVLCDVLCVHRKLSYHNLKQVKYVERDVIHQIVATQYHTHLQGVKREHSSQNNHEIKCEENETRPEVKHEDCNEEVKPKVEVKSENNSLEDYTESKAFSLSLANLLLCEECIADDLRQHLYDLALDEDFKMMGHIQNIESETGWWVVKEDFKNFKKLVRQGGRFNRDVECKHKSLEPDVKRRKLVSSEVHRIVEKYFSKFPAPSYSTEPCQICSEESDTERLYLSSILLLKRDLQRLISDSAFPFIPSLTPHIIPTSFIKYDLQPFYRRKIQERISLDNSLLICKHSLLASDALDHAAFVKESEWCVLVAHFGPTITILCEPSPSSPGGVRYTPSVCTECVMLHDVFIDQVVYLREDKTAGKRGKRGDKILHLSSYDTVREVKIQICEKMAIAPSEQTLRTQAGRLLDQGTMRELGVVPGSIIYLEYNQALLQESEIFDRGQEQGFKGTVLSGL